MFVPNSSSTPIIDSTLIRQKQEEIGRWIQQRLLSLYPILVYRRDYQLMISEIQCNDPSCVPIETLMIIVLNDDPSLQSLITPLKYSTKILKPLLQVVWEDIIELEWPFILLDQTLTDFTGNLRQLIANTLLTDHPTQEGEGRIQHFRQILQSISSSTEVFTDLLEEEKKKQQQFEIEKKEQEELEKKRKIQEANESITIVKMTNKSENDNSSSSKVGPALTIVKGKKNNPLDDNAKPRHEKGSRRRGCPCCDPDNLDNKIDKMMFLDIPPN